MFKKLTPSELTEKATALRPFVAKAICSVMNDVKHFRPILQDVHAVILASDPPLSFQHEQQFRCWLWETVIRLSKTHLRKYGRDTTLEEPDSLQEINAIEPEKAVEDSDLYEHFLSLLNTDEQDLIRLWTQNQSHQEVADVLGIEVTTCRKRYSRIMRKLRKHKDELNL